MKIRDIRQLFLDYFKRNGHEIISSSSLVPHNDPSLMFTNSGMVQFKNYFVGKELAPYGCAATVQKCVRAGGKHNDLENVGDTPRHHTFFEMLGNFSFGQYFKEQAIHLAWELLTKEFAISKERLYVTVFHEDEEAKGLWKKIAGLGSDRIIPITTSDNFWSMGETGPCGPCSEIFYDHGKEFAGGLPGTPEQDGNRYVEIWNLVFMQYEDHADGKRTALPRSCIDTGMGLERMAAVLQGKHDNFATDLFQTLIMAAVDVTKCHEVGKSHRVIADHIRSISFLIADGVMPSNEGRGYVLRRIMRRAMRHAYHLGLKEPGLFKLVGVVVGEMGEAYPELVRANEVIKSVLQLEEERFMKTLDHGMRMLAEESAKIARGGSLSGDIAFKLYDTYGFPVDLTADALSGKNISVDMKVFEENMQKQKQLARASWSGSGEVAQQEVWYEVLQNHGSTDFMGYSHSQLSALVVAVVQNGRLVDQASAGECVVVLNQTPFYAESGGQVGDIGILVDATGVHHEVKDTKKYASSVFGHHLVLNGAIRVGDVVEAKINVDVRNSIKRNHSATHLLHKALRDVLGEHVAQKGSWVGPDRLRFDFSHNKALETNEILQVEELVNIMVVANNSTNISSMGFDEAVEKGAMALFGEKYASEVRVVQMGDSMELCGGTHAAYTGEIGLFKVLSEESVSFGVRRIEAITGLMALHHVNEQEQMIKFICGMFKSPVQAVQGKIETMLQENKQLQKICSEQKVAIALKQPLETLMFGDAKLCVIRAQDMSSAEAKILVTNLQQREGENSVILILLPAGDSMSTIVSIGRGAGRSYDARQIIKDIVEHAGGNGGGKQELAQAGGVAVVHLDAVIELVKQYLSQRMV